MADLIPLTFADGTTIYVEGAESAPLPGGPRITEAGVGESAERALQAAHQLAQSIRAFCANTLSSFQELSEDSRPTKATVEFGLNVSLEGNLYVVKSTGNATIKVSAEWDFTKIKASP